MPTQHRAALGPARRAAPVLQHDRVHPDGDRDVLPHVPAAAEEAADALHLRRRVRASVVPPARAGVRRWPLLGRFLRWRHARTAMQLPLFAAGRGDDRSTASSAPRLAPGNLATLLTWVHYRGLLCSCCSAAGNLFCMACPFMLPRDSAAALPQAALPLAAPAAQEVARVALFVAGALRLRAVRPLGARPRGRPG